jgi:hypothetical protein
MLYYAYFNPIMNYGLLFWENSTNSANIFTLNTKDIIRNSTGYRSSLSCRDLFKNLKILLLQSQYLLSLLLFVINNENKFTLNSDVCNINIMT